MAEQGDPQTPRGRGSTVPAHRAWPRLLAATYSFFALAAGSRALIELIVSPGRAPLAYGLSVISASLYGVGAVAFRHDSPTASRVALCACACELVGVLAVGAVTAGDPARWGDSTIWSAFGAEYGFIPLALPLVGLAYLRIARSRRLWAVDPSPGALEG